MRKGWAMWMRARNWLIGLLAGKTPVAINLKIRDGVLDLSSTSNALVRNCFIWKPGGPCIKMNETTNSRVEGVHLDTSAVEFSPVPSHGSSQSVRVAT